MIKAHYLLIFCIFLALTCCVKSKQEYWIKGTLSSNQYDGEWIYLVPMHNAPGRVDSTRITDGTFSFRGKGEEMRVLRVRPVLRFRIQELLVITEPGTIVVRADSTGSVTGTPQNDALQAWKQEKEKKETAFRFIEKSLQTANKQDSLLLVQTRDNLIRQEQEMNFRFLKEQGDNTVGQFMRQRLLGTLTDEQKKLLNENSE